MPKPDQMVRIQGNDVGDGEKKSDCEKSAETSELQIDPTREKGSWIIQKGRKSSE